MGQFDPSTELGPRLRKVLPLGAMHYVVVAEAHFARTKLPQGITPHNFRDIPFVAFNRKDAAKVDLVGSTSAVDKLQGTTLGL